MYYFSDINVQNDFLFNLRLSDDTKINFTNQKYFDRKNLFTIPNEDKKIYLNTLSNEKIHPKLLNLDFLTSDTKYDNNQTTICTESNKFNNFKEFMNLGKIKTDNSKKYKLLNLVNKTNIEKDEFSEKYQRLNKSNDNPNSKNIKFNLDQNFYSRYIKQNEPLFNLTNNYPDNISKISHTSNFNTITTNSSVEHNVKYNNIANLMNFYTIQREDDFSQNSKKFESLKKKNLTKNNYPKNITSLNSSLENTKRIDPIEKYNQNNLINKINSSNISKLVKNRLNEINSLTECLITQTDKEKKYNSIMRNDSNYKNINKKIEDETVRKSKKLFFFIS